MGRSITVIRAHYSSPSTNHCRQQHLMPLTSSTQRTGSLPRSAHLAGSLTDWKPRPTHQQTVWVTGFPPSNRPTACLPYVLRVYPPVFCLRTCWKESMRDGSEGEANGEKPKRADGGWRKRARGSSAGGASPWLFMKM